MQTNEELIRAVLSGHQAAFAELVRRYERTAWATAWKVLRDHHAAQDATQDAFVEAYRHLRRLRRPEFFGVWLVRISQRVATRMARRRRTQSLGVADGAMAAAAARETAGDAEALLAAVGGLPEHERLVVTLRYLDGHAVADVARLTGRPLGTVTKQLSRAVERLKSILQGENP